MHGLINNWEWYDYIQVEICIHGFNIFFFFLLRKKEPVLNMHEFWGWGESALDIRSLIHELNIHTTNYNN